MTIQINIPDRKQHGYDKLYKVRPLLDILNEQFKGSYSPTQDQTIDKSMIKFKGRISFKQYMPTQPIKRGYNMWKRSDAKGYVCQFELYTGKTIQINTLAVWVVL